MNWRCPPHLLAALGLLLGGCSSEPEQGKKELPRVTVTQVQVKPLDDLEYFTGRTVAVESVDIRARVTGYLKEVKFKAGEEVVKGRRSTRSTLPPTRPNLTRRVPRKSRTKRCSRKSSIPSTRVRWGCIAAAPSAPRNSKKSPAKNCKPNSR